MRPAIVQLSSSAGIVLLDANGRKALSDSAMVDRFELVFGVAPAALKGFACLAPPSAVGSVRISRPRCDDFFGQVVLVSVRLGFGLAAAPERRTCSS